MTQTPSESRMIPTVGPTIHAQIWAGSGPHLILIHGIGSSGHSWRPVIEELREHVTPVAIDLRGHGQSGKPDSGYLYDNYVDDLDAVIDYLKLDPVLIMGHSLGGIVALWWGARHSDEAAALIAEDTPLRSGKAFMPSFDNWIRLNGMTFEELRAHYEREFPSWTEQQLDDRTATMLQTAPAVFTELRADSLAHDGVDRIAELTSIVSPVLLVHGDMESGGSVVPADLEAFKTRLSNAQTIRIPGGQHNLHRENREAFLGAVVPFLKQHTNQG